MVFDMYFSHFFQRLPIRWIVFSFILWSNSSFSPSVKNAVFHLNDHSLEQPFHGDSVHFVLLLISHLAVLPLIVYLTECYRRSVSGDIFPCLTFRLVLRYFFSGFLYLVGFIEVLKRGFTELRPHFITSCIPDVMQVSDSGLVTSFICSGVNQDTLFGRDMYKSFPSGHAALSIYSYVFFNIYLYKRQASGSVTRKYSWLLGSFFVLSFAWAFTCCITRIFDNRHFWWDVLVGIALGVVAGMFSIRALFKKITALPREKS